MRKNNKGFTLIELLAIIVILAIIAVITVPIILNVIDNAKKGTAKDSAYGYKDAISKYYVSGMLEDESIKLSGDYNVVDGKLGEYDIPFSGTKPTSGYLTFENNALTSGCLTIDEYKVTFDNGEVTEVEVGECESKIYKCKRADISTLHTEECKNTSGSFCNEAGYTLDDKGTTITYGNTTIKKGVLTSGDAYDCDVNGDNIYDSEKERFYYVSDLFNTTTKQFDDDYAVLIYYSNFFGNEANNTSSALCAYTLSGDGYKGPTNAKTNLPSTTLWKNVSLSNPIRAILNINNGLTTNNGNYTYPTNFSYEGYAARLITGQEIESSCGENGNLNDCNFLMENTDYSDSSLEVWGYWLENPSESNYSYSRAMHWTFIGTNPSAFSIGYGTRPVIEVLKTDIEI